MSSAPFPSHPRRVGASRLPQVGTTIFTVMSALAAGHNQYAPMPGVPALRQAIAAKQEALYGHRYDADQEITVHAGATQAIMTAVFALVHPGDEVIVFEPVYDSYVPSITLAGATPVYIPLDHRNGYAPDWQRVRDAITPRTRLLMLNFPHNPTGRTLGDADLRALEDIVAKTGILLLSDEVYEHIVFDGQPHTSRSTSPLLAAHSVEISSFGKTFHPTGWQLGYAMAPAPLSAEIRKVHQFMVFAVNTPAQHAVAAYLADPSPYLELPAFYQAKRDRFVAGLQRSRFRPQPCPGTYFVLADYSAISDQPEAGFAKQMITDYGVAVIPVSIFYERPVENRMVRFCFAKKEATLDAALERLQRA